MTAELQKLGSDMNVEFLTDIVQWIGTQEQTVRVPLAGRTNPVILDPLLAEMAVDGIARSFNPKVPLRDTAVLFINHATRDGNETYDPKIDDTLVLDALIQQELLRRYPQIRAENVLGSWPGR